MRTIIFCLLLLATAGNLKGADKKFPVSEIPDSLIKNAHVVMRMDDKQFIINSIKSTTLRHHYVITILNGNGDAYAAFSADYDKLHKVSNIEGNLFDKDGNLVKKLKAKDIKDISGVSDDNLIDDSRLKVHDFLYSNYPYTVEYSYETNFTHTFYFPAWIPVPGENVSIQSSTFSVQFDKDYKLRYHALNITAKPEDKKIGDRQSLQWSIKNMPPVKLPEDFASWKNVVPIVFLAPSDFQLDGKAGNMNNWKDFGAFIYQLIDGKDELPENIKSKVAELTGSLSDNGEKVKALYAYLQQNTRYISIQLGVGGWVPFDAKYVAAKGYGDCKALTNYMHSLLKEAGITSYYTLVRAGSGALDQNWVIPGFSSNQFNHVILCIPGKSDTMWLECTSQIRAAGYMSSSTGNRNALMICKNGGYLVRTPEYGLEENNQNRVTKAVISDDGLAKINIETAYKGTKQDFLFNLIKSVPSQKVKEYLSSAISLPTFDINHFNYDVTESSLPVLNESLDITAYNYATISGKRIFLTPNIITKYPYKISMDNSRKVDFEFEKAYTDSDLTEIILPKGYKVESAIKPVELKTDFAYYKMECRIFDDKIIYNRVFEQYQTKKSLSKQQEIISFYQKIFSTDRARIVLVKE